MNFSLKIRMLECSLSGMKSTMINKPPAPRSDIPMVLRRRSEKYIYFINNITSITKKWYTENENNY